MLGRIEGPLGWARARWAALGLAARVGLAAAALAAAARVVAAAAGAAAGLRVWLGALAASPAECLAYTLQSALSLPLMAKVSILMLLAAPLWIAPGLLYMRVCGTSLPDAMYEMFLQLWGGVQPVTEEGDESLKARAMGAVMGLVGVVVSSTLLGVVVADVERSAEKVFTGNGRVVEAGHTVVLAGTADVLPFLRQAAVVHLENRVRSPLVVLTEGSKAELDDRLQDLRDEFPSVRIITREGKSTSRTDLARVGAGAARKIVVLGTDGGTLLERERSVQITAMNVKTLLPEQRGGGARTELVVGLRASGAAETEAYVASALRWMGGGLGVTCCDAREDLGKVVAQSAVNPGLYRVLRGFLEQGFDSPEFYLLRPPASLRGATYREVRRRWGCYGTPVGVYRPGAAAPSMLNPSDDLRLRDGDSIVVASDKAHGSALLDQALDLPRKAVNAARLGLMRGADLARRGPPAAARSPGQARRFVVLGDSDHSEASDAEHGSVTRAVGKWAPAGASITVVDEQGYRGSASPKPGTRVRAIRAAPTDPGVIAQAGVLDADSVILSSTRNSDLEVLAVLANLLEAAHGEGRREIPHVVALVEEHDSKEAIGAMLSAAGYDAHRCDVVEEHFLSSAMLAQVASQPGLKWVFDEILNTGGSEIGQVSPGRLGIPADQTRTFRSLSETVKRDAGLTLLGIQRGDGELVLCPRQDTPVRVRQDDALVVLGDVVGDTF